MRKVVQVALQRLPSVFGPVGYRGALLELLPDIVRVRLHAFKLGSQFPHFRFGRGQLSGLALIDQLLCVKIRAAVLAKIFFQGLDLLVSLREQLFLAREFFPGVAEFLSEILRQVFARLDLNFQSGPFGAQLLDIELQSIDSLCAVLKIRLKFCY